MNARNLTEVPRRQTADETACDLERWLDQLRQAMRDTGWTVDALAGHWKLNRSYVWRLVDGEKPWSVERLVSLPRDVQARLEQLRGESFGLIVVKPLTGVDAQRAFVAGLMGLLGKAW